MTERQLQTLRQRFIAHNVTVLHHGDCIGADAQAHQIALELNIDIDIHPPIRDDKRAFCKVCRTIFLAKDYLIRNHDIVDASDIMFATPFEYEEQLRSGTWATIRYAQKQHKTLYIISPDGEFYGA